jgi:hypothetical protein
MPTTLTKLRPVLIIGGALAAILVVLWFLGRGKPPGDIIIIQPTPPSGKTVWYFEQGDYATPYVESAFNLNPVALGTVEEHLCIDDNNRPIFWDMIEAEFQHCDTDTTIACTSSSVCPSAGSCVTSGVRVQVDKQNNVFLWELIDATKATHALFASTQQTGNKWRSEFCGTLLKGEITVTAGGKTTPIKTGSCRLKAK